MPSGETVLCDSGPLVAIFDRRESAHEVCRDALRTFSGPLVTTWPALTEAFHFLEQPHQRQPLWEFMLSKGLLLEGISTDEIPEMHRIMTRYMDLPMDLADASLVVVAERLRLRKVFTLDRHFRLYHPRHLRHFEIVP